MTWTDEHNRSVWPDDHSVEWRGVLIGKIHSPVTIDGNRVQFTLQSNTWLSSGQVVSTGKEKVLVRLYVNTVEERDAARKWRRGDQLRFSAQLVPPPGVRNPGGFDYRRYLYRERVHWIAEPTSFQAIETVGKTYDPLAAVDQLRDYLTARVATVYGEPGAGLVRGMILGERKAVDVTIERQFTALGLIHLLAISGLHVGIVSALIYGGLAWLGVTREKAAWITLFCLPIYAVLTGANPPVVRAAIVGGLVLLAAIYRQWKDSVHFIALAAALMLMWDPYLLFSASFQLSFIITLGIVIGVPALSTRIPFGPRAFRQVVATTLVAEMCSFPLIIYYFNEYSLLSGLANFIVVPIASGIVIPLAFITVVLAALAIPLATLPAAVNRFVIDGVLTITEKLAAWDPFHFPWATPSLLWIGLYFVSLYGLFFYNRFHRAGVLSVFLLLVVIAYYPFPSWNRPLTVTFLDVGQGDAIVIETPKGQTVIVDAGGQPYFPQEPWQVRRQPFNAGEDVVLPYLYHRGIRKIDYLVMTHGDADHMGGMQAVVEAVPVKAFLRGPDTAEPSQLEINLLTAVKAKGIPVYRADTGHGWELEPGLYWQFVQPHPENTSTEDRNAQSLIVRVVYEGRSLLLTGDADQTAEAAMLKAWDIPRVDVLKAGHHGSNTSTGEQLLKAIQPQSVVLSVGANNRYNHPHPDVMERLRQANTAVYRTDEQGAIVVRIFAGGRMTIEPTVP